MAKWLTSFIAILGYASLIVVKEGETESGEVVKEREGSTCDRPFNRIGLVNGNLGPE
jgi:hypothetical protein